MSGWKPGAISRAPRSPREEDLELLAKLTQRISPDEDRLTAWYERYATQHQTRLAIDLELVEQQMPGPADVLEYGAVPLLVTAALVERGYRVRAVDLAPERFASAIATLGLDVRRCDVEREVLPFADASFDLVLCNELFEHLRIDPIFTFEQLARVLRPGGLLLLSTPNLRSLRGLRNLMVHHRAHAVSGGVWEQYEKIRHLGHMGHVREYTPREVVEFLTRCGFHVEKLLFRGGHGRGLVGLLESLAPTLQPFFSVVAVRP